jgi:hypothetical protein
MTLSVGAVGRSSDHSALRGFSAAGLGHGTSRECALDGRVDCPRASRTAAFPLTPLVRPLLAGGTNRENAGLTIRRNFNHAITLRWSVSHRNLELAGVVLLFGICGAGSSRIADVGAQSWVFPIPFSVACALLYLRSVKTIFVVPLYVVVWLVALNVTTYMAMFLTPQCSYVPMCTGGLIGGLGVCLASGIVKRCLLSPRHLFGACVVGCVAALPFGVDLAEWHAANRLSMNAHVDSSVPPWLQFAIWQAGVGTYLYTVSTGWWRKSDAGVVIS